MYIIDTSDPDNMTIERNGRLPLERGNDPSKCQWPFSVSDVFILPVGPLPLLLIPIPHVPEAFILITVSVTLPDRNLPTPLAHAMPRNSMQAI